MTRVVPPNSPFNTMDAKRLTSWLLAWHERGEPTIAQGLSIYDNVPNFWERRELRKQLEKEHDAKYKHTRGG